MYIEDLKPLTPLNQHPVTDISILHFVCKPEVFIDVALVM